MVSLRYHNNVVTDFEQLVKLLPPQGSCVPAAFNGAPGRLLAEAGVSPRSMSPKGARYQSPGQRPIGARLAVRDIRKPAQRAA